YDGIANGIAQLAAAHRLHVVGGNLTKSPGPLAIDVTVVGTVKRRQALRRSGARAGDDVYVSGTPGAAAAGLALLKQNGASPAAHGRRAPRRRAADAHRHVHGRSPRCAAARRRVDAGARRVQPLRSMIHLTRALIRRWLDALLHIEDTPERTAAAFALGVFFGFSPFLGLHTLLGILFAFLLNLNRVAVLLGVYSNLPWVIAPYYAFTTVLGAQITGHRSPPGFKSQIGELFALS